MVNKRSRTRQRRAPAKNASSKKAPPKNARAPREEQPLTAGEETIDPAALREAVPTREPEALMRIPGFRRRVIQLVVQKLC